MHMGVGVREGEREEERRRCTGRREIFVSSPLHVHAHARERRGYEERNSLPPLPYACTRVCVGGKEEEEKNSCLTEETSITRERRKKREWRKGRGEDEEELLPPLLMSEIISDVIEIDRDRERESVREIEFYTLSSLLFSFFPKFIIIFNFSNYFLISH